MSGMMTRKVALSPFSREGPKVVLRARRVNEDKQSAQMIREAGGEALFVRADDS